MDSPFDVRVFPEEADMARTLYVPASNTFIASTGSHSFTVQPYDRFDNLAFVETDIFSVSITNSTGHAFPSSSLASGLPLSDLPSNISLSLSFSQTER